MRGPAFSLSSVLGPLALCAGCATTRGPSPVEEFRGRYSAGFEVSRFVACGAAAADQPWWVILSAAALRQRDSLMSQVVAGPGNEVYVRWRGVAGPLEPAGHLGQSTRYVHVTEILELRSRHEADCREAGSGVIEVGPSAT